MNRSELSSPLDRHPPRPPLWTPAGYLLLGLGSLAGALIAVAIQPDVLLGGILAPALVGIVHLTTLGFVTATILGSLYLVSPFALRTRMGEGAPDLVALTSYTVGTAGMVWSFSTGQPADAVLASSLVVLGVAWVAVRTLAALARSKLSFATRLPFVLAWTGLASAIVLGLLHALDGGRHLLGATVSDRVAAHAHVGLAGWALVLVMAVGNRLLPMLLPSAMPEGPRAWIPAGSTLLGSLLYAAGRIVGSVPASAVGLAGMLGGLIAFLASVAWMLRHGKPPGQSVPTPDPPRFGVLSSILCLVAAAGTGATLASGFQPPRLVAAYGALLLVGFFGQMILAVQQRLVPWLIWMRAFAATGHRRNPPTPYRMPLTALQKIVLGLWAFGPWVLAGGILAGSAATIGVVAAALALAVLGQVALLWSYGRAAYGISARS